MATRKPIRIGETFITEYRFYNPVSPATVPPTPNLASPINLTGITITYNVKQGENLHTFTTTPGVSGGVTVTPLTGIVAIELEKEQTVLMSFDRNAEDYLAFAYAGGNLVIKAPGRRAILNKEDVR